MRKNWVNCCKLTGHLWQKCCLLSSSSNNKQLLWMKKEGLSLNRSLPAEQVWCSMQSSNKWNGSIQPKVNLCTMNHLIVSSPKRQCRLTTRLTSVSASPLKNYEKYSFIYALYLCIHFILNTSFYFEYFFSGITIRLSIFDDYGVYNLVVLVKFCCNESFDDVIVTYYRNFFVFFGIVSKQLLHLPYPRSQLPRSLVYSFFLQQSQHFCLFFLKIQFISFFLIPSFLMVGFQMLNEPQFICVFHMPEIKSDKLFLFLLQIVANIADIPENFSYNGMHLNFNISVTKYFIASFKGSLIRRHQYYIDLFLFEQLPGAFALFNTLWRQGSVDVLFGIADGLSEPWHVQTVFPESGGRVDIAVSEVVEVGFVEMGLAVTDEDQVVERLGFHWWVIYIIEQQRNIENIEVKYVIFYGQSQSLGLMSGFQ